MDQLIEWCSTIERTLIATRIRESLWVFPAIEIVHLLAMIVFVSTVGALDLRLLGLASKRERVSALAQRLLPWSFAGFFVMAATGVLLFMSNAAKLYVNNPAFQLKLLLIVLAGINALAFHMTIYRRVNAWDMSPVTPPAARLAAASSLLLWIAVVAAGRWTGFV